MNDLIKKNIRPCSRKSDQFLLACLLAFLITLAGQMIGQLLVSVIAAAIYSDAASIPPAVQTFITYLLFIGIWIILVPLMFFPNNEPMYKVLGKHLSGNTIKLAVFGLLAGSLINAVCVGASILLKDISLRFNEFNIGIFLALLFAVFVQSGAEELIFRGYLFEKLRRRYRNPMFAIVMSALGFTVLHGIGGQSINPLGFINIFLVGIITAMMVHYYNSLWAAILFHTGWNFTQSIFFGLPNSGLVFPYSNFVIDAASDGLFFSVLNGVEGSIGADVLLLIAILILAALIRKQKPVPHDLWEDQ